MKTSNLLIHLLGLLFLTCTTLVCAKSAKSAKVRSTRLCQSLAEVDRDLARLYTYGRSGRAFPENLADYVGYCKETERLLKTLEVYSNECLDKEDVLTKSTLKVLAYTVRKELRNLCKAALSSNSFKLSKRQQALLQTAHCTNQLAGELQTCIDQSNDYLVYAQRFNSTKTRLMYICCNFHEYESCFRQQLTHSEHARRLPQHCNARNTDTVINFIDAIQNSMINLMCADYADDSDRCAPTNQQPPPKGIGRKWKSFVLPLVEVMDDKSIK